MAQHHIMKAKKWTTVSEESVKRPGFHKGNWPPIVNQRWQIKKICSAKSGKQQNENHFEQDKYTEEKKSWKKTC